jgi:hypothetical protein
MNKKQDVIDKFVIKELSKELKNWFIIQDKNDYLLFNQFKIVNRNSHYEVLHLNNSLTERFYNLKNAVTWCICEKLKKYDDSETIRNLDRKIENYKTSESIHKKLLIKTKEKSQKEIYYIKFVEDVKQKTLAQKEMENYINISRYWLNKKLNELTQ